MLSSDGGSKLADPFDVDGFKFMTESPFHSVCIGRMTMCLDLGIPPPPDGFELRTRNFCKRMMPFDGFDR